MFWIRSLCLWRIRTLEEKGLNRPWIGFFEYMVPFVTGKGEWRKNKSTKVVSEIVSPTDEAFALVVLENKYETWIPKDSDNVPSAKYTSGNRTKDSSGKYEGWNIGGLKRFNELTQKARTARNSQK